MTKAEEIIREHIKNHGGAVFNMQTLVKKLSSAGLLKQEVDEEKIESIISLFITKKEGSCSWKWQPLDLAKALKSAIDSGEVFKKGEPS